MKFRKWYFFIFIIFLLNGCLTTEKNKNSKNKNIETYQLDLDGDGIQETVEIEDKYVTDNEIFVKVIKTIKAKEEKSKTSTFSIPGHFRKVEFVDLDDDGFKQMVFHYDTKNNFSGVDVYKIRNDKVSKIFSAQSACDVDTDLNAAIPRIKIGKDKDGKKECLAKGITSDWEVWVWSGDRFIKER